MKKKIVWDLFGGLNGSVGKALDNDIYDIYTFDILPKTKDGRENIVIDLTQEIDILILKLSIFPYPDIIVASPMCNTFSRARGMKGGVDGWIVNGDNIIPRSKILFDEGVMIQTRSPQSYDNMIKTRELGVKAINNTLAIISHFKPTYFYVENPMTSLIWIYIRKNYLVDKYYFNHTDYGSYNADMRKRTIFFSNVELKLKWKLNKGAKFKSSDAKAKKDRSDIPIGIIKDIFDHFIF